jgi:hypothetical protein
MPARKVRTAFVLVAGVLLVGSLASPRRGVSGPSDPPAGATMRADPPAHCCFENPRYVGQCDVAPGDGETCASILEYLNNPQSQGKTYCGSTSLRGGWMAAVCKAKPTDD